MDLSTSCEASNPINHSPSIINSDDACHYFPINPIFLEIFPIIEYTQKKLRAQSIHPLNHCDYCVQSFLGHLHQNWVKSVLRGSIQSPKYLVVHSMKSSCCQCYFYVCIYTDMILWSLAKKKFYDSSGFASFKSAAIYKDLHFIYTHMLR